jgi:mRNA-degrading endonuclease toxin of MazEF toxin-antitoxin module
MANCHRILSPDTKLSPDTPFEIVLPPGRRPTGVVLASQCRSVDWLVRRAEFIGTAARDLTDMVAEHVRAILFPD